MFLVGRNGKAEKRRARQDRGQLKQPGQVSQHHSEDKMGSSTCPSVSSPPTPRPSQPGDEPMVGRRCPGGAA